MTTEPPDVAKAAPAAVADSVHAAARAAPRIALLVAAAVVGALAAIAFSGAALAPALSDPGAFVRWGTPVVGALRHLLAAVTVGGLVLAVCIVPRHGRAARAYRSSLLVAGGGAVAWTLANAVYLVLAYARAARAPLGDPGLGEQVASFALDVSLGRVLLAMTVVAAVVSVLALAVSTSTGAAWTLGLAFGALAMQATTGHAAGAQHHELAISALFLHLAGAAVWVGALVALALLAGALGPDVPSAVARYSPVAGWCFAAVGVSGVVSAGIRLGGPGALGSDYGVLVLVKVALLVVLGALGWAHRRWVIARFASAAPGAGAPGADVPGARRLLWRLVTVELAVMGAVVGVATGLGSSPPPVPDVPPSDPTPAEIVTGHPLPVELTGVQWIVQWRWDLLLAAGAVAAVVVYLRWVVRLRRRGDAWPVLRTVSWTLGWVVFFWATSGGPAMYGHVLFSAHMVQHMVLAMVVPVLLVLSAPVTLALRALPGRRDGSRGPREWILTLVNSRLGRFLANPVVAAVNFAGSMVAFYFTIAFELALTTYAGHLLMTVHFTLAGYLFANALVGIDPGPRRPGYPLRLLLLFATMVFHAFFGVVLTTGEMLLVPDWFGLLGRDWGPSAIEDQQLGGAVTWGIGELPVLALAIGVAVAWARDDERLARRRDRSVDRDGDAELEDYNAMLARLAERDSSSPPSS